MPDKEIEISEPVAKEIVEICKSNSFYMKRTDETQFKVLIQGLDFAELNYNGVSWNLTINIDNNKSEHLKKIQNLLNNDDF